MSYQQVLEFLFSKLPVYQRIGKAAYKNDLNNSIALDNYFGHPHRKYRTIHVAGTNGKGSVSHMIASVLQEAGYQVGLYTSPHLKDFRERIKVNGEMIFENEVVDFVKNHKAILELINPSFFEMTVALALNHFAMRNVEVAVIEVGLGGRLDSTNIIKPVLSVITNIGYDHMNLLGYTLEKIAAEKAGIIKKTIPVIIGESHSSTKQIFISRASESGSAISFADEWFLCEFERNGNHNDSRGYRITDQVNHVKFEGETGMTGDCQSENLKTVFSALSTLKGSFNITDINIKAGIRNVIRNTGLKGRWQTLSSGPLTICDTGHNKEALEYSLAQIQGIKKSVLHIIIGFVDDKDLESVLPLFPTDAVYYFTKAPIPRALNEEILRTKAEAHGLFGQSYGDVKTALIDATKNASSSDLIFIGGSTFIVAEVI